MRMKTADLKGPELLARKAERRPVGEAAGVGRRGALLAVDLIFHTIAGAFNDDGLGVMQ